MKRKQCLTRKRRALRYVAWCLGAILVANHVFGVGLLTPRHAVWQMQEREGIAGPMRTVCRDWAREIRPAQIEYLEQNEKP